MASLAPASFTDLVEVNAAFCTLVGSTRQEVLGRSALAVFDPVDRPPVQAMLERLARGQQREIVVERQLHHYNSTRVWVTIRR
ncbi:PAS domain-containing protein [Dactylosporangium sp. CS-047395]|uniref:PAS domain-containing protein n=1 Tax=Dactylosporangium sp. CS-047395 TaxID=3239936 RepID=UPI003D8C9768